MDIKEALKQGMKKLYKDSKKFWSDEREMLVKPEEINCQILQFIIMIAGAKFHDAKGK